MLYLVPHDDESQVQFSPHVNYITLTAFHLLDQTLLLTFVTLATFTCIFTIKKIFRNKNVNYSDVYVR